MLAQAEGQIMPVNEQHYQGQGRPKDQNHHFPPTGAFSSIKYCLQLCGFLSKKRFIYFNQTNGQQEKQTDQYDQVLQENIPAKQRIAIIQWITANKFNFINNGQTVVFFFKQNHEKNPEVGLEYLNPHYQMTLSKIQQLLTPKFFKELVYLLQQIQNNWIIEEFAKELLSQAKLSADDNTIIQYLFIKFCYVEADEAKTNVDQLFIQWKNNQTSKIIEDIKQFIFGIKVSLQIEEPVPVPNQMEIE